ncbi:MAG: hypothetical protein LH618_18315, partial [Saprospiraceae bacterium]|nr:hypothetical protein [Saprospiraceae bacterium]
MFKNQTPQQLSLYIASASAIALAFFMALLRLGSMLRISWGDFLLLFLAVFAVAFFTNYYLIRYYIFRRIKLIYKIIHRHKLPADFKASKLDMRKNILQDIEQEVDQWA